MQIQLKKNNQPKKHGFFIVKRENTPRPEVAEVRQEDRDGSLTMLSNHGVFPVKECGPALWSDEIFFTERAQDFTKQKKRNGTGWLGATVRLRKGKRTAIVVSDNVTIGNKQVKGGVMLDNPLGGVRYWNIEDLIMVVLPK